LEIYRDFNIEGDEFAVLAALTLGYTDALQPDLRASYSASGAMHILSVSGLHVGIVYVVIAFLLGFLNKSQRQKVIKTNLIYSFPLDLCVSYRFISFSGSRNADVYFCGDRDIFGTEIADLQYHFHVGFFMLLVNPNFLFDVSFQLSYAAVLSIVFFQHPISNLFPTQNKALLWLRDLLAVSVAAQLGTVPFTLYYFHQFPNYFLLTNLVAIPLSTLVIYLAIGLLFVSFIPYLSVAVAFLLKWSLWLLNFLIVGIENLPHAVSAVSFDFRQMTFVLVALFCVSAYFYTKKFAPLFAGLSAILMVSLFGLQIKYETLNSKKLIVYSGQKFTHVNFIDRSRNFVYTTDSAELQRIAGSFWKSHKIDKAVSIDKTSWYSDGYAYFGGKRILILNEDIWRKKAVSPPLYVDYLIIGNKLKPKINQLIENVRPGKIIVDKSISEWYTENIRQICKERNIPFYSVAEKGAYILNFTD